ncbi:MAG: carbohydrate kinase family protein [Candidatus Binatia bacterium]
MPAAVPGGARRRRAFDIVGVGANTLDHVCVLPHPLIGDRKVELRAYEQLPGGQVPTALVALQRWGMRTAYLGAFADDAGGELQRASLTDAGVDVTFSRPRRGAASQTSIILVDALTGERAIAWRRPAGLALRADELDPRPFEATRAVLLDADDAETALRAAALARAANALVMLDVDEPGPHTGELLALADVAIVPTGFAQRATGAAELGTALRRLVFCGPRLAVTTLGAGGALACRAGRLLHVPAVPAPVVDTTSAGDCFHAGCLYGLLQRWPLHRTLRFAAAAAALACTRLGGRPSVPELSAVLDLLQRGDAKPRRRWRLRASTLKGGAAR